MTMHVEPIGADEGVVRQFFEIVHEAAGQACAGIADPGRLQLSRVHPADDKLQVVGRFEIGDVDSMTAQAVADAAGGFNSYVEGRTVRADLSRTKRGELDDTIAVFGLVVDADGDKGRDGVLPEGIEPSLCVSSSPGNRHDWLFLTRALPANEAHAIGAALRATTGGDHDTGTVTQPYRVAGTPNYPGRAKVARGRVVEPTSILTEGRGYSPEELRAFFPPAAAPSLTALDVSTASTFRPSHLGRTVEELLASLSSKRRDDLAATDVADRSAHFFKVTGWLKADGYSFNEAVTLWSEFVTGAAYDKYGARMAQEVHRVWPKVLDDPDTVSIGAAAAARLTKGSQADDEGAEQPKPDPIDFMDHREPPAFPSGVLPSVIEEFARVRSEMMGADPAGLAMAALTTCAALLTDRIRLRMKRHDDWMESPRLWCALIGAPSTMKSPVLRAAAGPLLAIDGEMVKENRKALAEYDELKTAGEKPTRPQTPRLKIEDITIEKAQERLAESPDGVLAIQDELSGWFGSMDRYSGAKGGQKDRGFWLQAYNGGLYDVARIGRGDLIIENLSVCLLGGIQPDLIRKIAGDTHDDGLLQRMIPIVLRPGGEGRDEPMPNIAAQYGSLARGLHRMQPPFLGSGSGNLASSGEGHLVFDDEGQEIFRTAHRRHRELIDVEVVNAKLGTAIGKYDGIFGRLAIVFHCIEHADKDRPPRIIAGETVGRVDLFMRRFLFPHALAFYSDIIGMADDQEILAEVAGFLLAHPEIDEVTFRTFARGSSKMRRCKDRKMAETLLDRLDAFGWLHRRPSERNQTSDRWTVNPRIHELFADRARKETDRRSRIRARIAEAAEEIR